MALQYRTNPIPNGNVYIRTSFGFGFALGLDLGSGFRRAVARPSFHLVVCLRGRLTRLAHHPLDPDVGGIGQDGRHEQHREDGPARSHPQAQSHATRAALVASLLANPTYSILFLKTSLI